MINIMMVDDDEDDRLMFREAMDETRFLCDLITAVDGHDMATQLESTPLKKLPALILLDLNMPRMDGREALELLKSHEDYQSIPVVILTTSKAEEDILKSYNCGANSYIPKPVTFDGLRDKIVALTDYWFDVVELPARN